MKRFFSHSKLSKSFLILAAILFWLPGVFTLLNKNQLSTLSAAAFFFAFGLASIFYMLSSHKQLAQQTSKGRRFSEWVLLLAGVACILIGFGLLQFEPILILIFSFPFFRTLSTRSIKDILHADAGSKAAWLDRCSDALFILASIGLLSFFFGFYSLLGFGLVLLLLSLSLVLDQVHFGLNHKDWGSASSVITLAVTLFASPGIVLIYFALTT